MTEFRKIIVLMMAVFGVLSLSSCGKREPGTLLESFRGGIMSDLGEGIREVGLVPRNAVRELLGVNKDLSQSNKSIQSLKTTQSNLNTQLASQGNKVQELSESLSKMTQELSDLESQVDVNSQEVESRIAYLNNRITLTNLRISNLLVTISDLESRVRLVEAQLATLETNDSIVEFIDPCGDDVGHFDEVVMVTSNGSFVAYFDDGVNRFLTVLSDGNYRTTDNQRCRFRIDNGELLD